MIKIVEQGVLLTFDEIRILLYGMGVTEIEGIYMPEKKWRRDEILNALHHMTEVGMIEAAEEKFVIREDIKELLTVVAHPDQTEIWSPHGEHGPSFFLYEKQQKIAVSECFYRKKDTLKLSLFEKKNFITWKEEVEGDHCGD